MAKSAKIKLQQALVLLLDEEEFGRISVSKICKKAGVHRSTFYSYYDHQFELLEDAYHYLTELFIAEFKHYQADYPIPEGTDLLDDAHLIPYLNFVKGHQKIYHIYLTHELDFRHKDRFDGLVNHIFLPRYHAYGIVDAEHIVYMSSFFIAGITQVIAHWLRKGCAEPVEEIADIIQTCIPKKFKS